MSTFEWVKTYSNHHHIEEKRLKTSQATFTVWLPSVEVCSSEGIWCQICGFFSLTLIVLDKDFELCNHGLFLFLPCSCISAHTFYLLPFPFSYSFSFLIPFPLSSLFLPLSISEFHFPLWYLASEKTKMSYQVKLPELALSFSQELWFFSITNLSNHLHPMKGLDKKRTNYVTASSDLGKKITHFLPHHRRPLLRLDSIIHAVSLPAWDILWFYDSVYIAQVLR